MLPNHQKIGGGRPLNLVCDGNSLTSGAGSNVTGFTGAAGSGISNDYPSQLQRLLPRRIASTMLMTNLGIPGQTWRQMDGLDGKSSADVDSAYVPGYTNVLVAWETTNAITLAGRTAAQAVGDAQSYIANRLAAHPGWIIVMLTTLPRQGDFATQAAVDSGNASLLAADAMIRAQYQSWGVRALVDVRCPGSPFRFPSFTTADFGKDPQLWNEPNQVPSGSTHLRNAGYALIAQMVWRTLMALPVR